MFLFFGLGGIKTQVYLLHLCPCPHFPRSLIRPVALVAIKLTPTFTKLQRARHWYTLFSRHSHSLNDHVYIYLVRLPHSPTSHSQLTNALRTFSLSSSALAEWVSPS